MIIMSFSVLMQKMLIFVVLMVIGYICARTGYISKAFVSDASKITLNVFMVATIINSVAASDLALSSTELLTSIGVMSLTMLLLYASGSILSRTLPMQNEKRPVFDLLISVVNTMFMGLPVVSQVYGGLAVFYVSLSCLPFNLLLYSYGVYRLNSSDSGFKFRWKSILCPPLIATVISILLFLFRLSLPLAAKDLLYVMSNVTMPLSMFVVGASLGSVRLIDSFTDINSYVVAFFSLIVSPLLVWLILRGFVTDDILLKSAVILAGCPSGVVVTILSIQFGKDYVSSSKAILLSTVLSVATLPLVVYLLG